MNKNKELYEDVIEHITQQLEASAKFIRGQNTANLSIHSLDLFQERLKSISEDVETLKQSVDSTKLLQKITSKK